MNSLFPKISLFAGVCLIAAGFSSAQAQQCYSGYGGDIIFERGCSTSSPSGITWDPVYDSVPQDFSGYPANHYYGGYYQSGNPPVYGVSDQQQCPGGVCSIPNNQVYSGSNQQECPCGECAAPNAPTAYAPQNDIEVRLSYIERVLTFIISFLGLDDEFEKSQRSGAYAAPQPSGGA